MYEGARLWVNDELPENRRYARPWASRFATDTARAFYSRFHQPLHLNSAVRTVAYQLRLQLVNGNAAAVDGDGASPHLTGQALDFGKRGMSTTLEVILVRGGLADDVAGHCCVAGRLLLCGKNETFDAFQDRAVAAAVEAGEARVVIGGLPAQQEVTPWP